MSIIVQSDDQQVIQVDKKLFWISLTGIMFFLMDETPRIMMPKLKDVGKRFKYANQLKIHDQIHSISIEKLYACKYCDMKFNLIGDIIAHGEKLFICEFFV